MKVRFVSPAAEAMPLITPVELLRDNPVGRVPVMLNVRGGTPPEAESVVEKYVPLFPCCKVVVVKISEVAADRERIYDLSLVLPVESVTLTVIEKLPDSLGVPNIIPFVPKVIPVGSMPLFREKLSGSSPPLATMVAL